MRRPTEAQADKTPKCHICDGSGRLVLMNSWFPADGYRRERCGICGGTGVSAYRSSDYERQQRDLRERFAQFKAGAA